MILPTSDGPIRNIETPEGIVLEQQPIELYEMSMHESLDIEPPEARTTVFEPPPVHSVPWNEQHHITFPNNGNDFYFQVNTRSYFDRMREPQDPNMPPNAAMPANWKLNPAADGQVKPDAHLVDASGLRMT